MIIRRRVLKIIIVSFIIASLLLTWYINRFLAPTTLKNYLITNIAAAIDRPVSLKAIHFNLITGFTLNELTIYEPDGENAFIKVDHLSTSLPFNPTLIL